MQIQAVQSLSRHNRIKENLDVIPLAAAEGDIHSIPGDPKRLKFIDDICHSIRITVIQIEADETAAFVSSIYADRIFAMKMLKQHIVSQSEKSPVALWYIELLPRSADHIV